MKVYLLYSSYDDGQSYESQRYDCLEEIVDSEEMAKKWVFSKAVEMCNRLMQNVQEYLDMGLLFFDSDGPYYTRLTLEEIETYKCKEELSFYSNQLDKLKFGDYTYTINDFNGYEQYRFSYKAATVIKTGEDL